MVYEGLQNSIQLPNSDEVSYVGFIFRKRVTAACVDDDSKFIAVGNCVGEVKVLNFSSGGVMYTLPC